MPELRTDCYFYCEIQDMNAYVPNCVSPASGPMFGSCPCSDDCKYFIDKREAQEIARKAIYNEIDRRNRLHKINQSET